MRRLLSLLVAFLFPVLLAPACGKPAPASRTVYGLSGKIQVELPPGWEEMPDLHESADIEAGSKSADAYLVVVSERREILRSKSLEDYSQFTRDALVSTMSFSQHLGPRRKRIDGRLALQYEIRAIGKFGTRLVELHTVVESPEYFHQVVLWTSAERFKANEPEMLAIVESFRER